MALSTNPDISAALFSITSTASSDLDTATGFNRSDDNTEANVDISSTAHSGYEGIDWNRLPGYLASKQRRRQRTGWVWEHGNDIEKDSSGHRFWLCKECHQTKAAITHMYDAASTSQANGHMEDVHRINRGGKMSPRRKKQRTLFDMVGLDARQGKDQAVMNAFITSFDPLRFQRLLIRWVACDNVPFNTLESPYFRELMEYANSAIIESGSLPTYNTMREWIGRHCGENLAGRVSEIIYEYGFECRVGYFVTDNAESNDMYLEELATELGFNKQHHRLRCCGHIINLVARSILFGTDADAFEEDCQANKELQDEMRLWRAKGPIGKLHNIVHWVQRSGQRIDKLHKLQSMENTALGLEDRSTYDVITDNAARWNSSEAMMERGYQLRNPLDCLVQAEVTEWDQLRCHEDWKRDKANAEEEPEKACI
ncbi:hypothetical protein ACKAV7_014710 [Fusarium commune]